MKTKVFEAQKDLGGWFEDMTDSVAGWAKDILPDSLDPTIEAAQAKLVEAAGKVDVGGVLWQGAGALGVPLPLVDEITSLRTKDKELSTKYYTMQSYRDKVLPPIGRLQMPQAQAKADAVSTTLSQAQSQCVAAQKLVADAVNLGVDAQNQIKAGNVSAAVGSMNFFTKKGIADSNTQAALVRANGAIAQADELQRDATAYGSLKVTDVTQAAKDATAEALRQAEAAKAALTKFAPFALPLAIALLAGYAIMSIGPRRR